MPDEVLYLSAPFDFRGVGQADIPWDAMRPFQPLLGQDAQMAGFAALAHKEGIKIRIVVAPEIYGSSVASGFVRAQEGGSVLGHVRFGTPRLPRIFKGAANAILLAEDVMIPVSLGRHPFAAGAALPARVRSVFVYDLSTPVPNRIGAGSVSCVALPRAFATSDLPRDADNGEGELALGEVILQTCAKYDKAKWLRWGAPVPHTDAAKALARRTTVLLPWNLAALGSLIPDVLDKISLLSAQERFPLTIVVLPYNDVPGSLSALEEVAASCAKHQVALSDGPAILLARAGTIQTSLALLRKCRRVWIDATDPEWRWTLQRMGACGLPANFISALPSDVAAVHDPGRFAADASVMRRSEDRFALFWRTRVLSLRRLSELAEAVEQGVDVPFRPGLPEPPKSAVRRSVHDLLRTAGLVAHG